MPRGSGKTAVQESAQALFCAIADYLGEAETRRAFDFKEYPTYDKFVSKYKPPGDRGINGIINDAYKNHIEIQSQSLASIEDFLREERWYRSSVNIALALIKELNRIHNDFQKIKRPKWQDIFYVRGDKEVMESIAELFKAANDMVKRDHVKKTIPFGDINKWLPADMYFATDDAVKKIAAAKKSKYPMGFAELNTFIFEMMKDGDLLPLSLKMAPSTAKVYRVNYKRSEEEAKIAEIEFVKIHSGAKKGERSLIIVIDKQGGKFTMRHDPSNNTYKGEIQLKNAFGGGVSGDTLIDVMMMADKTFAKNFEDEYKKQHAKYAKLKKQLEKDVNKATQREKYDIIRTQYSTDMSDALNKLWADYLKKSPKAKADHMLRIIVEYAGSMSIRSSKFVIAK